MNIPMFGIEQRNKVGYLFRVVQGQGAAREI